MVTAEGRFVSVYNGEIYNFAEVRSELESLGEVFRSTGDSEVVLKAYAVWGGGCVWKFRGMFALGIWDQRDSTLFLARDRLGVKPLYMAEREGGIAFASEIRTLLAAGAVEPVLSPAALLGYFRYGSVQEPATILQGVRALPPASTLVWSGREDHAESYWSLPTEHVPASSPAEAVERIRPVLEETARLHLVSDVPFGVFLSGGVDSAALTALAARASPGSIHTFTATFDDANLSEATYAAEVASRFGCTHSSVHLSAKEAASSFSAALAAQDQPSADGLNTWFISRAARQAGLSMAWSGLGGDEIFAGYPNFRRFGRLLAISRAGGLLPTPVQGWIARRTASPGRMNRVAKAIALMRTRGRSDLVYSVLRRLLTDSQIELLVSGPLLRRAAGDDAEFARREGEEEGSSGDSVNLLSRLELKNYLLNTLLRDADSMSMASSLEVRVPFLDHRLVETVAAIPGPLKLDPSIKKSLLMRSVPEVPSEAGRRPKMGFVLPLREWFQGPLKGEVEGIMLGSAGPAAGLFLRPAVASAWSEFQRGRDSEPATRFLGLASLSAWCDRHRVILPW
jgi:asparagine synthase (glutamine-hydrolysing)